MGSQYKLRTGTSLIKIILKIKSFQQTIILKNNHNKIKNDLPS